MIELSKLRENPKNARTISDEHFAALRHSVAARPWMFPLRPIVARRSDGVVLGGNMRLRALLANGVKEVPDDWVRWADLDERERCRFDLVRFGMRYCTSFIRRAPSVRMERAIRKLQDAQSAPGGEDLPL